MPSLSSWRKKRAKRATGSATAPGHGAPLAIRQAQATPQDGYVKLWVRAFESLSQGTKQEQEDSQKLQDLSRMGQQSSSCTGEDVLANLLFESQQRREVNDKSWKVQIGTRTWMLRDVIEKILIWLGKFKEVGDIAVSFDPVHAALPWAAFRFLLQAATIKNQHASEILLGLEQAAKISLRCRIYEKLYLGPDSHGKESSKALESSIITTFKSVLSFLAVSSARTSKEPRWKTTWVSITSPEQFTSKLSDIAKLEKEVETAADICHRESSKEAHHAIATVHQSLLGLLDNRFSRLDDTVAFIWTTIKDDDRHHLLRWISDIPFESDLENISATRLSGTCEWLVSHPRYEHWKCVSSSAILWLHGIPGAGKTRLTSKVIEDTLDKASADESVAYFFCDRGREDRREPLSVLRSFVRQLTCCREDNRIMSSARAAFLEKKSRGFASDNLTLKECRALLVEFASMYAHNTIIIDGLDECDEKSRHTLIEAIDHIFAETARPVKLFIASRDDKDIMQQYGDEENLRILASDNQNDIDTYVKTKIEQRKWSRDKMSRQTKEMVEEVFRRKSNGMFQWAALHINGLLELESDALISDYLDTLPEGLSDTYGQIYDSIDKRKRHIFDTAFQWLIASWDELTPEELEIAVSQPSNAPFSPERKFDIEFIIATCKNLIHIVTESGNSKRTCQFVHLSVREYFEEHHWSSEMANDLVLGAYVRYCTHNLDRDSDTLSQWNAKMRQWDQQCASFEGRCSPETLALLLEFLGHPYEGSSPFEAWGCGLSRPINQSRNLLEFLGYPYESNPLFPAWDSSLRVLMSHAVDLRVARRLPSMYYDLLDWDGSQWRRECWVFCLIMGLHDAIRTWLTGGDLKPDARDVHGNTALNIAVEAGHEHICELLLDKGADANLESGMHGRALWTAARTNNLSIGKLLLSKGGANPNLIDHGYSTALIEAVAHGHEGFVKLLLEHGAGPNIRIGSERIGIRTGLLGAGSGPIRSGTALLCATSGDHITISRMLLEAGADVNLPADNPLLKYIVIEGMFERSRISSKLPVIKLLIALGANVNVDCGMFGTPLQIVLGCQYPDPDFVRVLKDAGAVYDKDRVRPEKLSTELREILGIVGDDDVDDEESWGSDVATGATESSVDDWNGESWGSDASTVSNGSC